MQTLVSDKEFEGKKFEEYMSTGAKILNKRNQARYMFFFFFFYTDDNPFFSTPSDIFICARKN